MHRQRQVPAGKAAWSRRRDAKGAETRRQVVAALAGLPDRYRTAVLLKDGLGLPAEGVATAMGISVPAVRSVLHRARAALRESLPAPRSRQAASGGGWRRTVFLPAASVGSAA